MKNKNFYIEISSGKKKENEIYNSSLFNMLKVLKLYSWEEAFKKKILKRREKELNKLREIENISLFINTVYWSSTTIISVISIVVYNLFYEQMNYYAYKGIYEFKTSQSLGTENNF